MKKLDGELLLCRPADLIQHLLEGPDGSDVSARCAAAAKIASLSGVNGIDLVIKLLTKWLRCMEDPMDGDDDVVRNVIQLLFLPMPQEMLSFFLILYCCAFL